MIGLLELLSARGFVAVAKRVKLVRHKDSRLDLEALRSAGWLDTYQKYQSKPIFDGCDQIVVFFGEDGFNSRFIGVYDVGAMIVRERLEVIQIREWQFRHVDLPTDALFVQQVKDGLVRQR